MVTEVGREPAVPEYVFGPLSTVEGRARRARSAGFGFYHDSATEPLDPRPGERITIAAQAGAGVAVVTATLSFTVDGTPPHSVAEAEDGHTAHLAMKRAEVTWDTSQWRYAERWESAIPAQPAGTRVRYIISAITSSGHLIDSPHFDLAAGEFVEDPGAFDASFIKRMMRDGAPRVYEFYIDEERAPAWLSDAVLYQIFVDRFAPDPGRSFSRRSDPAAFQRGTLKGVMAQLDYLSELGVNCLWLTPVFPSPSHHGYDATDHMSIEPRLGSEQDLRRLLEAAHTRRIRVLLDFVANHVSNRHPAFVAASRDPASPTRPWFYFDDSPAGYRCYYDIPELPVLNTDHPGVRDYLIGAACHWLALGCDGFRLDHAHGVTHGFWSEFRTATRAVRPDCVTIGEITETPPVTLSFAGRMDGVLDFGLLELLRSFFVTGELSPSEFDIGLSRHFAYYGTSLALPSFLDNHDMNRLLWSVEGDQRRLRLAAVCQFALPGPPIIYYGTEVGLSQRRGVVRLEEARLPMLRGDAQDSTLLAFYRMLIRVRRDLGAAWSKPRRAVLIDDRSNIYAFACGEYLVALNNRARAARVSLPGKPGGGGEGKEVDLLLASDEAVELQGARLLYLPAFGGAICRL